MKSTNVAIGSGDYPAAFLYLLTQLVSLDPQKVKGVAIIVATTLDDGLLLTQGFVGNYDVLGQLLLHQQEQFEWSFTESARSDYPGDVLIEEPDQGTSSPTPHVHRLPGTAPWSGPASNGY